MSRTLALLSAILIASCTTPNPGYVPEPPDLRRGDWRVPDGPPGPVPERAAGDLPPSRDGRPWPAKPNGVDVLLVIDNSGGMGYPQEWLGRDIASLFGPGGLESLPGGASFRVGIVSTDVGVGSYANQQCTATGDKGKLIARAGCPQLAGGAKYLQRVGGTTNWNGSLSDVLGCMINLGEDGCGFEQPLEAMRMALAPQANPGFLRDDAALAVLILTNEDDCSAQSSSLYNPKDTTFGPYASFRCFQYGVLCDGKKPPLAPTLLKGCGPGQSWLHEVKPRYVDFLKSLKPPGWVTVLVLAAQPAATTEVVQVDSPPQQTYWRVEPTCQHVWGLQGDPAFRLMQLADGLGSSAIFSSVCATSYVPALKGLYARVAAAF
jgi:hypothetical protein